MADGKQSRIDAVVLKAAYERLRDAVLSGEVGGWRLGHGVLCARGMCAWMSALGELAPPAPASPASSSSGAQEAPAGRSASLPQVDQVVQVLAQMVLPLAA